MEVWLWLIIIVILSIVEASTAGLVSVWFIASGIVSLILAIFKVDFIICFSVFVLLGLLLMVSTRKYLIKLLKVKKEKTNIDRVLDMKGVVVKDITKDTMGEVKVDGKIWNAYSNEDILKNTKVRILKIDSTKLKVEKWEE